MSISGISVNATNLFPDVTIGAAGAVRAYQYEQAVEAYLRGAEQFMTRQGQLAPDDRRQQARRISSVISVWLRAVDDQADPHLPDEWKGRFSVAQAKLIAELHQHFTQSERFKPSSTWALLPCDYSGLIPESSRPTVTRCIMHKTSLDQTSCVP